MHRPEKWPGLVPNPAFTADELLSVQYILDLEALDGLEPAWEVDFLLRECLGDGEDDGLNDEPPVPLPPSLQRKLRLLDDWEADFLGIALAEERLTEPETAIQRLTYMKSRWMQVRIGDDIEKSGTGGEWAVRFQCSHETNSGLLPLLDGAAPVRVTILPGTSCVECRLETARTVAEERGWAQLAGSAKVVALGSEIRAQAVERHVPPDGANEAAKMLCSMVVGHLTAINDGSWWVDRRFDSRPGLSREAIQLAVQGGTREQLSLLLREFPDQVIRSLALRALPLLPPTD